MKRDADMEEARQGPKNRRGRQKSTVGRARAQMYRDVVLEAAERVFGERGYHAAPMQEVARAAGISLQTLYATFSSKRRVFEALHEERGAEFLGRVSAALSEGGDARATLRRGVGAFVAYLVEHPDYFRVDLREGRSWALGDVESSPAFRAGIEHWTGLMERGIAEGVFHEEDPVVMAATAFGLMQIQLAARLARPDPPDQAVLTERIATQLERAFCRETSD